MKPYKAYYLVTMAWVFSVAVAYALGWWAGISSATHVAADTARSSFPLFISVVAIVALLSAIAAFRARGYFTRSTGAPRT